MRSTPDPAPPGATVLWGNRGGGNVVIRRDLPTGKGERPSSHTPEPEDDNHVVGGRLGFVPGRTPRTRIPSSPHPSTWNGKRLASSRTPSQYGGKGRNRDGFGRLSFDGNDGRGSPREDPKDVQYVRRETARGEPRTHGIHPRCAPYDSDTRDQ